MVKPAIVAVGYNRPHAMKRLLDSICAADYPFDDIALIVSIDECEKSDQVEAVARDIEWKHGEKVIRRFPERQGLRKHVLQCGDLSQKYGAIIVLEDDLMVSPSFYHYTYHAVNKYINFDSLAGVSLYSHAWNGYANLQFIPERSPYDVYFGQYSVSWGQCWLKDRWADFRDWYSLHEDKLPSENKYMPENISQWNQHSWGKYFASYVAEKGIYYVVPYFSMTTNFSEIGQHSSNISTAHQVPLLTGIKKEFEMPNPDKAVKYDMFFERILNGIEVAGIPGENICVNLNSTKKDCLGHPYVLTTQKMTNEKVASFGMMMHPIDSNVVNVVSGNDIFLYRCDPNEKLELRYISPARIKYEMYDYSWKLTLKAGVNGFIRAIKSHIKQLRK